VEAGARQGDGTAGPRRSLLLRAVDVRPEEASAVRWAFVYFFALLSSFYLLRPVREEMGIRGGVDRLHWLFTATFLVMLAAVPAYSALVARVPRARAIPVVYRFFLANVLLFWGLFSMGAAPVATARAFFVWLSVFNLFVVSVFWSFMADLFTSAQGKRLFGCIAGGGSAGALVGSAVAGVLVGRIGIAGLLLVSAALLELAARCARRLAAWSHARGAAEVGRAREDEAPVGGGPLHGIRVTFRSPYLAAIAAQTILFSVTSTFLYFQQARIVAAATGDSTRRTAIFAAVDFAVNAGALLTQSLAAGRLAVAFGLGPGLAGVPALSIAGLLAVAAVPAVWTVGAVQAIRRTAHYGLERPARDVLFTVVSREEKYKAKGFIDTVIYRAGDALSAWIHAGLVALGLALGTLALAAIPVAIASIALALWLARRQARMERT
jgi:ATP:ADP antiporter, AAA family